MNHRRHSKTFCFLSNPKLSWCVEGNGNVRIFDTECMLKEVLIQRTLLAQSLERSQITLLLKENYIVHILDSYCTLLNGWPSIQGDFLYLSRMKLVIFQEPVNQIIWNFNLRCVRLDTDLYYNFIEICWKLRILLTFKFFVIFSKVVNLPSKFTNFEIW